VGLVSQGAGSVSQGAGSVSQGVGLVSQGAGSVSQGVGFTHVERVMGMAVSIDVRGVVAGDLTTMAVLTEL